MCAMRAHWRRAHPPPVQAQQRPIKSSPETSLSQMRATARGWKPEGKPEEAMQTTVMLGSR
eukprot:9493852-Pyramimonas_sp.AAC.1